VPPPKPIPVDWIMAGKKRGQFSNYVRDDSRLANRITDHFVIRATVTMRGAFTADDASAWPPPAEEPTDPAEPPAEDEPTDGYGGTVITRQG